MSLARRKVIAALKRAGLAEPMLALRAQTIAAAVSLRRTVQRRPYTSVLARHADLLMIQFRGRWELARRDEHLITRDVMVDNLDLAASALKRRKIPHFVLPTPASTRHRIGVPAAWRSEALDALFEIADPAAQLYLDDPDLARRRRRVVLGRGASRRVRARALRRSVWRVYVNRADVEGRTMLGDIYGCEVEFWSTSEKANNDSAPSMLAERWNRHATELPTDVTPTGTYVICDRSYPTLPEFTVAPHFEDITFPIDLVYTWVDGDDPEWLGRKNATLRALKLDTVSRDAYDASRYRNHDELKYSLRSVAMFADFVRRVYIVTDGQTPAWLNTDNPRVKVVNHKEIFDGAGRLPTFNSHAIEARLHHIEGLAEHYLYLNDDFLFCRKLSPSTFFLSNGMSQFFPSTALIGLTRDPAAGRSVDDAARRSQELIRLHFGRITHQKMKHAPYPQRRSILFEAEEVFAEEFRQTISSQIRSPSDVPVPSSFSHYYAYLTGRAVPGTIAARYALLGASDFDRRLRDLELGRNADTLCINDASLEGARDRVRREQRLQAFFDRCWPVKSEFEW